MTKYLECPITHEIMQDPVIGSDGYTYEREAIKKWLQDHHSSPMNKLCMVAESLLPNRLVKSIINNHQEIQKQHDAHKQ